ncbi:GNAT family N-acetyltransferase [Tepidibacter hydrothermalis]|uniref:GNAT family N-acetyltransferase n=1 Tax=Tepidibacter hydrothermalis TaxID=3036126 RepID=A0ABY8EBC1_9FIRM|nr:GNAT family N-acetyltransferase [Tepidibacter hydrothermalis]WFD10217.1 GNAT family N-acetyltransferase [Tepidibacter hydrothermalis]
MNNDKIRKKYRFEKYDLKYFKSCADLVKQTWNLHGAYKEIKNIDCVYELYIRDCLDYSEYCDLIIDEDENVCGIMFGSFENRNIIQRSTLIIKRIKTCLWSSFRLLKGDFGKINNALSTYLNQKRDDNAGEVYSDNFSSEINLFIVSKSLRGQGYGYKLMNRYIEFCYENKLSSVFLWTDLGCSYSFYERYGFKLFDTFHGNTLSEGNGKDANGLIYCYQVLNN